MNKYLIIDTELTSFDGANANNLISAYFGIIENNKLIDQLNLKLVPDSGEFTVNSENMKVNNIDLRTWEGIKYKEARKQLGEFLRKYVYKGGTKIGNRLIPLGQDVLNDIKTIQNCLISKESWNNCVRLIAIDTLYFATILRDLGKLNLESLSLQNLANYFKINTNNYHTASVDAKLSWEVYLKLQELL